ncbi:class I SAM-dependent methyltransferase [Nostoc sp. PCC 7107]|uniref:class I SAM-dependent methyltransferase n=1 Tax=Nostoc sp. PCC 7107 TaxID=317936 RepID=UPI00029EC8F1|nr:class I SAM-dependent methyltransferase [Nostoc sp. PCC 7107]AFY40786.1 Methyltransferase type 11 [Nostoc sp. PCC 7107]
MATILRDLSYRYQWLYDAISRVAAISVGGETHFRQLALQGLTIHSDTQVLDLCCGSGQSTQFLVKSSQNVTGLDASPKSLQRAKQNVPEASYIEAFAENMPFANNSFDVVHTSAALHEMEPEQLRQILQEVYRILKPGGVFTLVDFHAPNNPIFWPGVAVFLLLFETETAWELIKTDLPGLLKEIGFNVEKTQLYAGGSLQVIHSKK